jgi:multicomponent Na+:H+ antiporter subunit E
MSHVLLIAWLTIMWVALWGELSWANALGGLVASLVLLAVYRVGNRTAPSYALRPLAAVHFIAYFLVKLVEANFTLAWEVVTPRNRINEGIVAVPIRGYSDGLITLVANAITLTPGTVTLEVHRDPTVLFVHVLHLRDIEDVRAEVRRLELLAVKAFGPPAAVAAVRAETEASR